MLTFESLKALQLHNTKVFNVLHIILNILHNVYHISLHIMKLHQVIIGKIIKDNVRVFKLHF